MAASLVLAGSVLTITASTSVDARTSDQTMCGRTLTASDVETGATCFVDARITRSAGKLTFPCAGGDARATFGDSTFTGRVTDGSVDVGLETQFGFTDGCQWRTRQRIEGTLSTGSLRYTYTEEPLEGQSGCASPCSARATIKAH